MRRGRWWRGLGLAAVVAVAAAATACGSGGDGGSAGPDGGAAPGTSAPAAGDRPVIAVTTPILGAVVADVVGDAATVEVVVPPGADPHDHRPSARDVEVLAGADLVVVNGLHLEEGLEDAVAEAEAAGVPVFAATDHLPPRSADEHDDHAHEGEGDHADDDGHDDHAHEGEGDHDHEDGHADDDGHDHAHEGEGDHDHGGADPHFWVDPVAMARVVAALAPALRDEVGIDVADRAARVEADLAALDAEVAAELAAVPAERRLLVTSHDSLGWFADRYGFTVVGALVPSLSSQGSASAGELADLAHQIEELGVPAIFLELGTPASLAETIAEQTGARVVELPSHTLPDDGSYATFLRDLAQRVAEGLAP